MNRLIGFYWIKVKGRWLVAEWDRIGTRYWWFIPGSDMLLNPSREGTTIIVNENRIIPPDQEAGKDENI